MILRGIRNKIMGKGNPDDLETMRVRFVAATERISALREVGEEITGHWCDGEGCEVCGPHEDSDLTCDRNN